MNKMIFRHYQSNNDCNPLRIPTAIDVSRMTDEAIEELMDSICESIGAGYLFDKSLVLEVVQDLKKEKAKPFTFGKGVYLLIRMRNEEQLIISANGDSAHGGYTVYDLDTLKDLLLQVQGHQQVYAQRVVFN
jgi:hypothetical protein